MFDFIASSAGLDILFAIFGLGMIGAVVGNKFNSFANIWSNCLAILGSVWGMIFASSIFATGHEIAMKASISSFQFFTLSLHVDKLAAFFIFVISLVATFCSIYGIGYVKDYYKRYNIGQLGFLYNAFILGMLLVVTAANGIWFLLAWEIMSLASYFLVVYDRSDAQNVKAGYVYLVMTHIGAVSILLAMLVLFHYTHSFDFDIIRANVHSLPTLASAAAFLLAFIGLGTKAGAIPLHIWLPSAHPAAPSHVSAIMSGVMIKTGIYMMIRLFLDIFQPVQIPMWWGVVVLIVGSVSCIVGVLYALTQHDIKRLLAYHSIENIGIILLGLGGAMIFTSLHLTGFALLALVAALFHTLNHAVFKALLFLSAGSVIHGTHTRNIEEYGGLLRYMPVTGLLFLIGSMSISALPPFNGFFSEWLTFQSIFSGLVSTGQVAKWVFLLAAASLAFTGGLALACFVKAFGTTFLARPRSKAAERAKESVLSMRVGMWALAIICLAIGVGSSPVVSALQNVGQSALQQTGSAVDTSRIQSLAVGSHGSVVSGPSVFAFLLVASLAVWLVVRYGVNRRQKVTVDDTWDCGTKLNPRMEITSTGFARSITLMFQSILRPKLEHQVEYDGQINPYTPRSRTVHMIVRDVYQSHLYLPAYRAMLWSSGQVKRIQNGNLNSYVLYIFIILILLILVEA